MLYNAKSFQDETGQISTLVAQKAMDAYNYAMEILIFGRIFT